MRVVSRAVIHTPVAFEWTVVHLVQALNQEQQGPLGIPGIHQHGVEQKLFALHDVQQHVAHMVQFAFAIALRIIDAVVNDPELVKDRINVHAAHRPNAFDHAMRVTALVLSHQFKLRRGVLVQHRIIKHQIRVGRHLKLATWADGVTEGKPVILSKDRDPRFITIRRGGSLTDSDHQLLALWAAACAEHVLPLFEAVRPDDRRPRHAIDQARAWVRGEIMMSDARAAAGHANAAARDLTGAARHAAYAAAQAAAVAHVAAHELGAAAYAIKAARAAAPAGQGDQAGWHECAWQRAQLPAAVRELVLDDQRVRNAICWSVFDC